MLFLPFLQFVLGGDLGSQGGRLFLHESEVVAGVAVVGGEFEGAFEVVDRPAPEVAGGVFGGERGRKGVDGLVGRGLPLLQGADRRTDGVLRGRPPGAGGFEDSLAVAHGRIVFGHDGGGLLGHGLGRRSLEARRPFLETGVAEVVEGVGLERKVGGEADRLGEALGRRGVVAGVVQLGAVVEVGHGIRRVLADRPGERARGGGTLVVRFRGRRLVVRFGGGGGCVARGGIRFRFDLARGGEGGEREEPEGYGGDRRAPTRQAQPASAPRADQRLDEQEENRRGQGPLETLDGGALELGGDLLLRDGADPRFENLLQAVSCRTEFHEETAGLGGDALEGVGIEPAVDDVAVLVADVCGCAGAGAQGDGAALLGADSDGIDGDPAFGGFARLPDPALLEVLPVGDQDDDPEVVVGGKGRLRLPEGRGQVGAPGGDHVGVHRLERLEEGPVVEGERALEEGVAGEGDEPDPVALELVDEILDGQFRADETVRLDVGGEHAPGGVEGEDDVDAPAAALAPGVPPLGPGEGEKKEGGGEQEETVLEAFAQRAVGADEFADQPVGGEAADAGPPALPVDMEEQKNQCEGERQEEQPESVGEFDHPGSERKRVLERRSSSPRSTAPARRGQKNSSSNSA